ncbi:MAG: CD225/dispanin family protein [Muribaculaceae bacterium]|nr:CD225/dispanin family protein [Muribaculaceae bacterium]
MKNIAILVSGEGEATERIVKLFNEGNRVKTVLVVVDNSAISLVDALQKYEVEVVHVADEEWISKAPEVAEKIKAKEVSLLVLDNFDKVLTDEIMESTNGEFLRLSSAQLAPREVVNALEANLMKPVEEIKQEENRPSEPTQESEWADALKIQFTPPKVPDNPPAIPGNGNAPEDKASFSGNRAPYEYGPGYQNSNKPGNNQLYGPTSFERRPNGNHNVENMPSTWLIWSILVTVFCCFIPGIIAIIFSSQVSSRFYSGDIEGARRASRTAEIWIIVSFVLGVISATLYLPFMLLGEIM